MIRAFEFYASEEHWNASTEDYQKHVEGLELFVDHYNDLGW
jgi:hypothetical protein